ncbi:MAG: hypothetical protein WBO44_14085 [Saprospiraceae bacterium]
MEIKIFTDGNKVQLEKALNDFLKTRIQINQIVFSTHVNLDYKPTNPKTENMTIYSVLVIYH